MVEIARRVAVLLSLLALGHASTDSDGLLDDLNGFQKPQLGSSLAVLQASVNQTRADCDHAVDDAKSSEEAMKVRLDSAVKAAEYCHHAQTMLTTAQQERALKTETFVQGRVAEALKGEQAKIQGAKQELEQCKVAMKRPKSSCVKETMAVLKLKSSTAVCTVKLAATQKQVAADKAAHGVEIEKLTEEMQKIRNKRPPRKQPDDPNKDDQIDDMQQDIHILKAELQAKTKESASARAALMSVRNHCREEGEELSESRDLGLNTALCLKLKEHSQAVCSIVGSDELSCRQLGSVMDASCPKAPTKEQLVSSKRAAFTAKVTADHDQIQEDNNLAQSAQKLLEADKLDPTHSTHWKRSEHNQIKLAEADRDQTQERQHSEAGILKSMQPAAASPQPDSQVQMLQAQLSVATAQVNGDFDLVQEYSNKHKVVEDLVRVAQLRGVAPEQAQLESLKVLTNQERQARASQKQDIAKEHELNGEFAHFRH